MSSTQQRPTLPIVAILAGVLVIVGSLATWFEVGILRVNGTDVEILFGDAGKLPISVGADGLYTVIAAGIAAALAGARIARPAERQRSLALAIAALYVFAACIAIYDWVYIEDKLVGRTGSLGGVGATGWGVQLVAIAAALGAVIAVVDVALARRDTTLVGASETPPF